MIQSDNEAGTFDTREDAGQGDRGLVRLWLAALDLSENNEEEWRKRARETIDTYRDEKERKNKKFPILYANTETICPAIYNSVPQPDIRRRYNDDDPTGKAVAQVLERAVAYSLDEYDFDDVMKSVVKDMVLPGRGVVRVRYEPLFDDQGNVAYERVTCECVQWDDFRIGPAKTWDKVPWVAFRHYLTREQVIALNEDIGGSIPLDQTIDGVENNTDRSEPPPEVFKRLLVWEVWDKEQREVLFIAPSYKDGPLKKDADMLKLEGFFPVPRPLYAIKTTDSLIPIELYHVYKDQADELDRITRRIMALTAVLKVRGIYAAPMSDAFTALADADDGDYSPSDNVEQFMQGGLDNAIWNWPIDVVVNVLQQLYVNREQTKQVIFEITGIADIMRGQTKANETLGAQQIKAQWGSLRVQNMQAEVQRFARDLVRLKAELIAEHFMPQTLQAITGIAVTPDMEKVMRSDIMRSYRIDIETDSTIRADVVRSQEQISQFIQGTGAFFQAIGPAVQGGGMPKDVAIDLYSSFARVFKLGRQAEDALERWSEQGKQPQQQGPDPAAVQAQMQAQQAQMDAQMKAQEGQAKMQLEGAKLQASQADNQARLAFEVQKHQDTMALEAQRMQIEQAKLALAGEELKLKEAELGIKTQLEAVKMEDDRAVRREQVEAKAKPVADAGEAKEREPQVVVVPLPSGPLRMMLERDGNGRVVGAVSE